MKPLKRKVWNHRVGWLLRAMLDTKQCQSLQTSAEHEQRGHAGNNGLLKTYHTFMGAYRISTLINFLFFCF